MWMQRLGESCVCVCACAQLRPFVKLRDSLREAITRSEKLNEPPSDSSRGQRVESSIVRWRLLARGGS